MNQNCFEREATYKKFKGKYRRTAERIKPRQYGDCLKMRIKAQKMYATSQQNIHAFDNLFEESF